MYKTGKLHKDAHKFLKDLAAHASTRRKIPAAVLLRYYLKLLSVNLTRRIGFTISQRAAACVSGSTRLRDAIRDGNERAITIGGTYRRVRHG